MNRTGAWLPWLLIGAGVAVYANGLAGPFLYDDASIVEDRDIRRLQPPWEVIRASPDSPAAGRPLVHYSLALNHALGGLDPRGYRLLNLGVHIASALLLFGVVRRTLERTAAGSDLSSRGLAAAAALIWMVHPLQTECVNYVSQRSESIMGAFYLGTLYASIRALEAGRRGGWIALAVTACALGMASKESMVTAPVAVALYDAAFVGGGARRLLRERGALYAGLAATWGVLAVLMATTPRAASVGFSLGTGALDYAKNQCLVLVAYLGRVVWPHPLVFDYGLPRPLTLGEVAPQALLVVALVVAAAVALLRRPRVGFPAAWTFLTLAPTSTFVPIVTEVGAERRMYLALAGPVVLAVTGGVWLLRRIGPASPAGRRRLGRFLLLAVLVPLITTTMLRNRDYADAVSLWRTAVAARPGNPRAHGNLGKALQAEGSIEEAISHYRRALEIRPDYPEGLNNLGSALQSSGRVDQAVELFRRAVAVKPGYVNAHYNLATVLQSERRIDEAVAHYRRALRLKPDHARAHNNLGTALGTLGDLDSAIRHFREALRIDPGYEEARRNLALALERAGRGDGG